MDVDDLVKKAISYEVDGVTFRSVLVSASAHEAAPMVLFAPNWFGVTDDSIERAGKFARDGYVCVVADMYGDGAIPGDFGEAEKMANAVRADHDMRRRRIAAAFEAMKRAGRETGLGDESRAIGLGYCFGGGNILELARSGADMKAAITVHGEFNTKEPASRETLKAAILALHGAADPVTPKEQRDAFEVEMENAGAKWQMTLFGGVVHSFCEKEANVPGVAMYDPEAAGQSEMMIRDFIARSLDGRI